MSVLLAAKLTLDGERLGKKANLLLLFRSEVLPSWSLRCPPPLGFRGNALGRCIDKRQRIVELLVIWKGYTGDTHRIERVLVKIV